MSAVTVLELYEGVGRSDTPTEKGQRILDILDTKSVVDADEKIMRNAGRLSGRLIGRRRRIEREDCIIAATGLLCDEAVLTRNVDHFERVDGLDVRSY